MLGAHTKKESCIDIDCLVAKLFANILSEKTLCSFTIYSKNEKIE